MLVDYARIDDQLAKISATVGNYPQQLCDDVPSRLSKIFSCWRQRTRHLREVGARDRAWRTRTTQRTLVKTLTEWSAWLESNRGVGAERAARKAIAEAKRSAYNY